MYAALHHSKPLSPELRRDHPLARGLVGCWPFSSINSSGVTSDISGFGQSTIPSAVSSVARSGSPYGATFKTIGSGQVFTTSAFNFYPAMSNLFPMSIFMIVNIPVIAGGIGYIQRSGANFLRITSATLQLGLDYTGAGDFTLTSVQTFGIRTFHKFGATWDGTSVAANSSLFADGIKLLNPTAVNGAGPIVSNVNSAIVLGTNNATLEMACIYVWNRKLSDAEMYLCMDDPWSLISPKRFWFKGYWLGENRQGIGGAKMAQQNIQKYKYGRMKPLRGSVLDLGT